MTVVVSIKEEISCSEPTSQKKARLRGRRTDSAQTETGENVPLLYLKSLLSLISLHDNENYLQN